MKQKKFEDYLDNFENIAASLKAIQELAKATTNQKYFAKEELLFSMKQKLIDNCSLEFLREMKKEIPKKIRKIAFFGPGYKNNLDYLDYLVEAIFIPLTWSKSVEGLNYFVAPGEDYQKSYEFYDKFAGDFIMIKELLGIEFKNRSDVEIGHALEFHRS